MDRSAAVVLTAVVGGVIALQPAVNSSLGKSVGTFQAAFLSFAGGTLLLLGIAALAKGGLGQLSEARHVPWYYLTGGIMGAMYVTTVLVTVRALGAGGVTAATIAGQLSASVAVDHYGWLGVDKDPINLIKAAGIVLLTAGVYLIVKE